MPLEAPRHTQIWAFGWSYVPGPLNAKGTHYHSIMVC